MKWPKLKPHGIVAHPDTGLENPQRHLKALSLSEHCRNVLAENGFDPSAAENAINAIGMFIKGEDAGLNDILPVALSINTAEGQQTVSRDIIPKLAGELRRRLARVDPRREDQMLIKSEHLGLADGSFWLNFADGKCELSTINL